jgi:hypothetical protein
MQWKPTEFSSAYSKAYLLVRIPDRFRCAKNVPRVLPLQLMAHHLVCHERVSPSLHPQTLAQRIICNTLESPISGDALKGVIAKIEQEVTRRIRNTTRNLPIYWVHQVRVRTCDLVELAPLWRQFAVATLPAIPTFVIGRAQAIPRAVHETKYSFIFLRKACELKRVQQEAENHIVT